MRGAVAQGDGASEARWRPVLAASPLFRSLFDHLPELCLIRLGFLETNLTADEQELRHFLIGFLPLQ